MNGTRIAALIGLLALAACSGEPESAPPAVADTLSAAAADSIATDPLPEFARRATAVELDLDTYREVAGTWTAGDATSTYTAYFDGDTIRLIEAIVNMGEYGESAAAYYFDGGALFYAAEDELRTVLDPDAPGRTDTLLTRAAYDVSGEILAAEQIVNGVTREAPQIEVMGLQNHAQALAEQASGQPPPAL